MSTTRSNPSTERYASSRVRSEAGSLRGRAALSPGWGSAPALLDGGNQFECLSSHEVRNTPRWITPPARRHDGVGRGGTDHPDSQMFRERRRQAAESQRPADRSVGGVALEVVEPVAATTSHSSSTVRSTARVSLSDLLGGIGLAMGRRS